MLAPSRVGNRGSTAYRLGGDQPSRLYEEMPSGPWQDETPDSSRRQPGLKADSYFAASPQEDSFETVAKHLECDEDKGRFKANLGNIARAKPSAKTTLAKRPKK